jgi:FKBP-type peptidyl-prolyl cis-trans isomerase 2
LGGYKLTIKKGDFIRIEYSTTIKETGELFDTTSEEEAKSGKIFKENRLYEPMLVVVNEGWVLKGLDNALEGLKVGKETTIELAPEQGFGLRDPEKIRLIPIRRLKKKNITPYPGAQVELEGKLGVVRSVGAGRVQIDFNPPLAGKTLIYTLTVKELIKNKKAKVKALIHRRIPSVAIEKFKIKLTPKRFTVDFPEDAFYLEGIQFIKRGILSDQQKFFPEIEKTVFTETFIKEKVTPEPVEAAQAPENDSKDT